MPGPQDTWIAQLGLSDGDNRFHVQAFDRAGNRSTPLELSIERVVLPPDLIDSAPPDESVVPALEPFGVLLRFRDPVIAANLNGQPLVIGASGTDARGKLRSPTSPGSWSVEWLAWDEFGNEGKGELVLRVADPASRAPDGMEVLDATPGWERWARRIRDPRSGVSFVLIDPGAYLRGSRVEIGRMEERPRGVVRISHPYYLAETEVTRGQWRRFVAATEYRTTAEESGGGISRAPGGQGDWEESFAFDWRDPLPHYFSYEPADEHPVTMVSWFDAAAFSSHFGYRLPSESEWEYACRAESGGAYWWGDSPDGAEGRCNVADEFTVRELRGATPFPISDGVGFVAPVASFEPNRWGLYDMLGNVWEWCADGFDPTVYSEDVVTDPFQRPESTVHPRVLRGGSWLSSPKDARCARRAYDLPHRSSDVNGFRPVLELPR